MKMRQPSRIKNFKIKIKKQKMNVVDANETQQPATCKLFLNRREFPLQMPTKIYPDIVGQFYAIARPMVIFGNIFGLMPLRKVTSSMLHFSWISVTLWYSLAVQFGIFILFSTSFYKQFVFQVEFDKIINLIFYGSSMLVYISFIGVARHWAELVETWERTEWLLAMDIDEKFQKDVLRRKAKVILVVVNCCSIVEHILEKISAYYRKRECWGFQASEAYFRQSYPDFFSVIPFSPVTATFAQSIHIYCFITKSYLDIFLIVVCLALKQDFEVVNNRIIGSPVEAMNGNFWQHKWNLYKRVHELLVAVNAKIDFLLLLSYSTNLYFICVQLLACMRQKSSAVEAIYLWFSLIFLIGRVLYLSLSAAKVNDESTRAIPYIRNLPPAMWSTDAERFLDHLTTETIALTGMNFFTLTRGLILKIVGTIVTYELVLFQFKEVDDEKNNDKNPCT